MLKKTWNKIKHFHFALLPVFFLLHINNFYYGLIPAPVISKHSFAYLALTLSVFLFSKVFFRSNEKAGLFTFITLGYFLGFGSVKDTLETNPFLHKITSYKIFFPLLFLLQCSLFFYLKKTTRSFSRMANFLFIAVSVNLAVELFLLSKNVITGAAIKNDLGDRQQSLIKSYQPCSNCPQPDVYFIIFDEFTSSDCLKKYWNYSNDTLDNFFKQNNFFVSEKSHSNYSFTTFSLSATLEMQYLNLPDGYDQATAKDLARGQYTIFENSAMGIFEKQGYNIHNYSIFDMKKYPAHNGIYFNKLTDLFISDETLFGRTVRDIGWNFADPFVTDMRKKDSLIQTRLLKEKDNFVRRSFDEAFSAIESEDPAQRDFFYFHFMIPHDPFVYNADGSPKKFGTTDIQQGYLEQLKYTNGMLINLVNLINKKSKGKAVIILQGDHGFKSWPGEENYEDKAFQNLNAIYLPDSTYTNYYDGVSPVNTFRLLFNHYFNTNFEILPDKSIPLFFKKDIKKIYNIRQKNT